MVNYAPFKKKFWYYKNSSKYYFYQKFKYLTININTV